MLVSDKGGFYVHGDPKTRVELEAVLAPVVEEFRMPKIINGNEAKDTQPDPHQLSLDVQEVN